MEDIFWLVFFIMQNTHNDSGDMIAIISGWTVPSKASRIVHVHVFLSAVTRSRHERLDSIWRTQCWKWPMRWRLRAKIYLHWSFSVPAMPVQKNNKTKQKIAGLHKKGLHGSFRLRERHGSLECKPGVGMIVGLLYGP